MKKISEQQIRQNIRANLIRENIFKNISSKIKNFFRGKKKNASIDSNKILQDFKQNLGNLTKDSRILLFLRYAENTLAALTDPEKLDNTLENPTTNALTAVKSTKKKINETIAFLEFIKLELDKWRSIKNQSFTNESYNFLNNPEIAVSMILKMDTILASDIASNMQSEFSLPETIRQDIQRLCDRYFEFTTAGDNIVKAKRSQENLDTCDVIEEIIINWCNDLIQKYKQVANKILSISAAIDIDSELKNKSFHMQDFNADPKDMPFKVRDRKPRDWSKIYNPSVQIGPDRRE